MNGGWLITGAGGMLARDLLARLRRDGERATGLERGALDITERSSVRAAFEAFEAFQAYEPVDPVEPVEARRPAVVVNCAAWTAVDEAEGREEDALRVNGEGPRRLAEACRESGAVLLHVSTDYVFPGTAKTPYGEHAPTGPRSAYGRTKLAGERAVLETLPDTGYVVRTAWLYGAGGANFVRTMTGLEGVRETLDVVDDQRGQPTWTADLADLLVRLGRAAAEGSAEAGIYHGTSGGDTTWFGLAREIFRLLDADQERVRPTTSDAFVRPAPRPAYSVLGHGRLRAAGIEPIRHWRAALAEALPSMTH